MWGIPWVHWGMFSTSGDIMSTLGVIMSTLGFSIEIERIYQVAPPNASWYPSDVLNIPQCTHGISHMHHDIPQCTNGISPIYWTSPDVHMISPYIHNDIPWCTEHASMYSWYPPMYWTSPDVLNIPQFTEHTLYKVNILWMNSLTYLKHHCDIFVATMVTISEQQQYIWKQRKFFCVKILLLFGKIFIQI